MTRTSALVLASLVLLVGCQDDSETGPSTLGGLQLATMLPTKDELGHEFERLQPSGSRSRRVDNARAAEFTLDPDDTAGDLQKAGRIDGYENAFISANPELLESGGVAAVQTGIDLFSSESAAKDSIRDYLEELDRYEGVTLEDSTRILRSETFDVAEIGDETVGLQSEFLEFEFRIRVTEVIFRIGRVVANAAILRTDDVDAGASATELARGIEARIEEELA